MTEFQYSYLSSFDLVLLGSVLALGTENKA